MREGRNEGKEKVENDWKKERIRKVIIRKRENFEGRMDGKKNERRKKGRKEKGSIIMKGKTEQRKER